MKQLYMILAAMWAFLGMQSAMALSHMPADVTTTLTTDITDTFGDVTAWVWAIFPVIALGWFAFNQARKGAGKFGAK